MDLQTRIETSHRNMHKNVYIDARNKYFLVEPTTHSRCEMWGTRVQFIKQPHTPRSVYASSTQLVSER